MQNKRINEQKQQPLYYRKLLDAGLAAFFGPKRNEKRTDRLNAHDERSKVCSLTKRHAERRGVGGAGKLECKCNAIRQNETENSIDTRQKFKRFAALTAESLPCSHTYTHTYIVAC